MADPVELTVNGVARHVGGDPDRPLLDVLRCDLGLTATRFGCGEGLCGACTVMADGHAITACNRPIRSMAGRNITTLEGLGEAGRLHPLQQAFIDAQAMQCGYCVSGVIMAAAALLATNPSPSDTETRAALDSNLCRCGAQNRMLRAIARAAAAMRGEDFHG
jgi:nicotinate dehydrogenase subunit A